MSEIIETIQYKGHDIEVFIDEDVESPNDWGNDEIFLVYDHHQFYVKREGFNPTDIFERMQTGKKTYDGYWFFPVYAYIHSGVALSLGKNYYPFTDRWDVSFRGFVLVKRMKGIWWNQDKAYEAAEGLIETWNQYLGGEVYGYTSEIGGCSGFYGDEGMAQMIEEAKDEIDFYINKQVKEHLKQLKVWIKNRVPYQYRCDNLWMKPLTI